MNKNIDLLRDKIDNIDKEMAILFNKRMEIIDEIKTYKINNNIPILNKERENNIIINNNKYINDTYKDDYILFINNILKISRDYQNK